MPASVSSVLADNPREVLVHKDWKARLMGPQWRHLRYLSWFHGVLITPEPRDEPDGSRKFYVAGAPEQVHKCVIDLGHICDLSDRTALDGSSRSFS